MTAAQQVSKKKKPVATKRDSAEIIGKNPTRRSRAERALVQLTTTSWPHYLIGNIVNALAGSDESLSKKALAFENNFGMLEFVRTVRLTAKDNSLEFMAGTVTIDATNNRIDKQLEGALTPYTLVSSDVESIANLAKHETLPAKIVELFHRNQCRGMTRRFEITADHWKLVEKKITLGNGNGLANLGRSETVFDVNAEDVSKLLAAAFNEGEYVISLGDKAIIIVAGDVTKEITYTVPDKA